MTSKKFKKYLDKRLSKRDIQEIEYLAELEYEALSALQNDVANAISDYMSNEDIGFNELVRRLDASLSQISKIQKGQANLTLATIAHIFTLLNLKPLQITTTYDILPA